MFNKLLSTLVLSSSLLLISGEVTPTRSDESVPAKKPLSTATTINDALQAAANSYEVGDYESALVLWQELANEYRQLEDTRAETLARINSLNLLILTGHHNLVPVERTKLIALLDRMPNPEADLVLARSYQITGEFDNALNYLNQAQTRRRQTDKTTPLLARIMEGEIAQRQGELERAEQIYSEIFTAEDPDLSLKAYNRAIDLAKEKGTSYSDYIKAARAIIAQNEVDIQSKLDLIESALDEVYLEPELEAIENSEMARNNPRLQARIIRIKSRNSFAKNQYGKAIKLAKSALRLDSFHPDNYLLQARIAASYKTSNNKELAAIHYKEAIESISRVKGDLLSNPDFQFTYLQEVEPIYKNYVSLLLEDPSQENLAEAISTIESLQVIEIENYFRAACLERTEQNIAEIDPTAAGIYPIFLEDRFVAIGTMPDGEFILHQVPVTEEIANNTLEQYRLSLNPNVSDRVRDRYSKQIYSWLIAPFRQQWQDKGITQIVIIPNGELRNVAFSALQNEEGKYLIEEYSLGIAPGIDLVRAEKQANNNAILSGVSEAVQNFSELPQVEVELQAIKADNPQNKLIANADFSKESLVEEIRNGTAGILHIASHGKFSSNPEDTFILTYENRIDTEGLRQVLQTRDENPFVEGIDLLVLSACESAKGDARSSLGLAGIATRSGAASTIATLWQVNDASTAVLMEDLYQQLNKETATKAEALQQAQLTLLDSEYDHPFYWAAFTLVGNWL